MGLAADFSNLENPISLLEAIALQRLGSKGVFEDVAEAVEVGIGR
jgi:hypothetical protein